MSRKCSICERVIYRSYFCYDCYKQYENAIKGKEEWVKFLYNCERKRRRTHEPDPIYLGEGWDIGDNGSLVYIGE